MSEGRIIIVGYPFPKLVSINTAFQACGIDYEKITLHRSVLQLNLQRVYPFTSKNL